MLSTNIYVNVIDYKINKELHQNKKTDIFHKLFLYNSLISTIKDHNSYFLSLKEQGKYLYDILHIVTDFIHKTSYQPT